MSKPSPSATPARTPVAPASPPGTVRRTPWWTTAVFALCGAAYLGLVFTAFSSSDDELLAALTVAPILFALTIPLALRIARKDGDRTLATIIMAGATAKLLMGYVQFKVSYGYYQGRTDAVGYSVAGQTLAAPFRRFDFSANLGPFIGTVAAKYYTGIVYAIFGTSRITGFIVFGWLSFLGLIALARAFRVGVPNGDARRYLIAVLFLPSLLYWPATIGKDALMVLGIGLASYGIVCLFRARTRGVFPMAVGLAIIVTIRPHVALIVFVGLAFALLMRRAPARNFAVPVFRIFGVVALVVLGLFLQSRASSYLGTALGTTSGSVGQQLDLTQQRTTDTEAGSAFTPVAVRTPLDIPLAFATVMFRPLPIEAKSFATMLSAGEGMLLLALLVLSRRRLRSIPRLIRTTPYVAFCIGYLFAFTIAFSRFANFGILARQRVQALPFLLVFIALPKFQDLVAEEQPAPTVTPALAPAPARPPPTGTRRRNRRPPVEPAARGAVSSGASFSPPTRAPR
jgi:hypothetical protein